jgi:hypothetical protein
MLQALDIVVVHSSDLHMDHDYTARLHGGDGTAGLASVLSAAHAAGADIVVLAGDTFDCHRVPPVLLERAAALISAAALPVVLLPGNHDPAVADAVYHNEALARLDNLHVLGVTHEEAVRFADIDLEIWGRAHRDYGDMMPFERLRPRSTRWQIAVAHGHYVPVPDRTSRLRPSWLIGDEPTTSPSGIGIVPRRSARWLLIIPARRNTPGPSTWCGSPSAETLRLRARRSRLRASPRRSIRSLPWRAYADAGGAAWLRRRGDWIECVFGRRACARRVAAASRIN